MNCTSALKFSSIYSWIVYRFAQPDPAHSTHWTLDCSCSFFCLVYRPCAGWENLFLLFQIPTYKFSVQREIILSSPLGFRLVLSLHVSQYLTSSLFSFPWILSRKILLHSSILGYGCPFRHPLRHPTSLMASYSHLGGCIWQNNASLLKRCLHSNNQMCGFIDLYSKKDFAGAIKLRVLRWEIILDHLGGLHVITRVLIKGIQKSWSLRRRCDNGRWR